MKNKAQQKSFARPNSDGRREQIVAAALKVMIAEGVYNTTTRKIADEAGINVATLHYHFHNKEEILFKVMEVLVVNYRATLAKHFTNPQSLHDRIAALLHFIWREIEKAPGEQLTLQEMTLYVLRHPNAAYMAKEKDREFLALYEDSLLSANDVRAADKPMVAKISNFVYTSFVGILNQWLATRDRALLLRTTNDLIEAAQRIAAEKRESNVTSRAARERR